MSMLQDIKMRLFHLLPLSIVKWYFQIRKFELVFSAEPLGGLKMEMGINHDNHLWVSRLTSSGGHELEICKWLQRSMKDNDVFFDVGSAHGFYPLLIGQLNKNVIVHCFQPRNLSSLFLKFNSRRTESQIPWKINEVFVGDRNEKGCVSLDAYSHTHGIPTIIKIDIDGPEVFALRGCKKLIDLRKTLFLLEVHPDLMSEFGHSWDNIFTLIPNDYFIRYLSNVRGNATWELEFETVKTDPNPFIFFGPKELLRN